MQARVKAGWIEAPEPPRPIPTCRSLSGEMSRVAETVVNDADEPTLDAGPLTGRAGSERTCIVNRPVRLPGLPCPLRRRSQGDVVPDVKARLPGRGAWVTATPAAVAEAVKRKLFARAFQARGHRGRPIFTDLVEKLLEAQAIARPVARQQGGRRGHGFAPRSRARWPRVKIARPSSTPRCERRRREKNRPGFPPRRPRYRRRPPRVTAFTSPAIVFGIGAHEIGTCCPARRRAEHQCTRALHGP